mmetsp:Transcript_34384/g.90472  ORF Transcript_34384/g.90472 Transcript_34384/m.90472 type:complete len:172 (+) Transcript_34384:83-598(+)
MIITSFDDARAEAGARIAAARGRGSWPAGRSSSTLLPPPTQSFPNERHRRRDGNHPAAGIASPQRLRLHPTEAQPEAALRPDLVLRQPQDKLDLVCAMQMDQEIQLMELQAVTEGVSQRRRSELWSLRSYTQDDMIFPHADDGRWWKCWAGVLCEGLGRIGKAPPAARAAG